MTIKILIADDHALFRAGVKTALGQWPDLRIIGEAENGLQLLKILKQTSADIVLLDIQMPLMDGLECLEKVKKDFPELKVIMLTMINDPSIVNRTIQLGANSYLTKEASSEDIYRAIRECYENDWYETDVMKLSKIKKGRYLNLTVEHNIIFSEKELQILELLAHEKTISEIAEAIDLSPRTIEAIIEKLKMKTGTKAKVGLVLFAISNNLIKI
jgi:DNA-binding NarL/FixJ family response regulator